MRLYLLLAAIVVVSAAMAIVSAMRNELRQREATDQKPSACGLCCRCCHHP